MPVYQTENMFVVINQKGFIDYTTLSFDRKLSIEYFLKTREYSWLRYKKLGYQCVKSKVTIDTYEEKSYKNKKELILLRDIISEYLGVDISTKRRFEKLVLGRQVYCFIANTDIFFKRKIGKRLVLRYTLEEIGKVIGYDHTNVIHARDMSIDFMEVGEDKITNTYNHIIEVFRTKIKEINN